MPKPTVFPSPTAAPDEEKTTVESGWEDEASTTVEQGDVAEKIRSLRAEESARGQHLNTNITSTNGNSVVDEPTVDDGHANAILTPPSLGFARLVVTQGNDSGQQIEVVPDKSYTIGRAIDNDVVLTDIAVSRKHFDLRHDGGTWVLADRGSGNGTLVNGNIEDQPFTLANGDLIEIGNTTFRFEQANSPQRPPPAAGRYEIEDEEQSTVASKPVRTDGIPTPAQVPPAPRPRPKTAPPPPLPRARTTSGHAAYPAPSSVQQLAALPGMPPIQQRPSVTELLPRDSLMAPQLLPQPRVLLPVPVLPSQIEQLVDVHRPPQQHAATTLPLPQMMPSQASHGTPPMPTTLPGQGVVPANAHMHGMGYAYPSVADMHKHAQMTVASAGTPRDATSTALVQPTPYGHLHAEPRLQMDVSPFSRRTKVLLIGAGLTLLAAIATIAIIKGSESHGAIDESADTTAKTQPKVTPIDPGPKPIDAGPKAVPATEPQKTVPKTEPPKTMPAPEPPKTAPKAEPSKIEIVKTEDAPNPEPPKIAPKPEPPKTESPKPPKTEPKPVQTAKAATKSTPKPAVTEAPRRPTESSSSKPDSSDVRNRALERYRAKQFSQAARMLKDFAATTSGRDATDLKTLAGAYENMGRHYNRGISAGAQPREAYSNLRSALTYDSNGPGLFTADIKTRLAEVSPKAAMLFFLDKRYSESRDAVRFAEGNGVTNDDTRFVRAQLDIRANETYREAVKLKSSDPEAAKQKVIEIRGMVDSASPIRAKAEALLSAG